MNHATLSRARGIQRCLIEAAPVLKRAQQDLVRLGRADDAEELGAAVRAARWVEYVHLAAPRRGGDEEAGESEGENVNFPDWFFEESKGPRIPVQVTRLLPRDAYNEAGDEVIGKVHWQLVGGTLLMSQEAFAELKRVAAAQPDERSITC